MKTEVKVQPDNGTITTAEARRVLADEQAELQQRQQAARQKTEQFLKENGYQIVVIGIGKKSGKPIELIDFLPDGIAPAWAIVPVE